MLARQNTSLEIRFSFLYRTTSLYQNGENTIVLRIIYRNQRKDVFTGITCPTKYWLKAEKE